MTVTRRWPLAAPLAIYAVALALGFDLLLVVAKQLHGVRPIAGKPFRLWHDALVRWDAFYYQVIATNGYPRVVPTDIHGDVLPNVWAFFPAFPLTTRALMFATSMPFEWAAVVLNVAAGAVAAVMIFRLVGAVADTDAALRAVTLFSAFPTAILLQVPYSEAMYLAFAAACLHALVRDRQAEAAIWLLAAGLSRGTVLPLSAAALVAVIRRIRRTDGASVANGVMAGRLATGALILAALSAPMLWNLIAFLVTGRPDAYPLSQGAWGVSTNIRVLFQGWHDEVSRSGPAALLSMPALVLMFLVGVTVLTALSRLPLEMKIYAISACALIGAVTQPSAVAFNSVPRFVFNVVTVPVTLAIVASRTWAFATLTVLSVVLQYWYVLDIWSGRAGLAP